jgi:hypothetical protein
MYILYVYGIVTFPFGTSAKLMEIRYKRYIILLT